MTTTSRRIPRLVAETLEARDERPSRQPPAPEENSYLAGEVIGDRYKLVRELGRGGMGVVWVAHSLVLGVDVALKLIRASAAGPAASRMAREAHAAARLGHPALVRVFDFGWTSRGDPFLVMELVQGETLSALLARESRLPAIRAVQMLLPIADGLRVAHEKTIVHRDIKPDNIFIATDALGRVQPKLLDFGIAKVGPGPHDNKLTLVGVVLGSPEYMSPEQALGAEDVDQRTDVWSLSVVLYEMLTATIPFRKANYNALMQAIIREAPLPITEHAAGDASLWAILERGLAKDPSTRWADMTEFGEALALWLYEHGIKEDLSGNSIRAVWLDGPLSAVRVETSESGRPMPLSASRSATLHAAEPFVGAKTTLARPRPLRFLFMALGVGAGVGAIVATVLLAAASPPKDAAPARSASWPSKLLASLPIAGNASPAASANPAASSAAVSGSTAPGALQKRPKSSDGSGAARRPASSGKRSFDFGF